MSQDVRGRRWGRAARASALGAAALILVSMSSASRGGPLGGGGGGELGSGGATPVAIQADTSLTWLSDGNFVLSPGENVTVAPSWQAPADQSVTVPGVAVSFSGPTDAVYTVTDWTANYGLIPAGQVASCLDTGDCYGLSVTVPSSRPQHWDATFGEATEEAGVLGTYEWTVHIGDSFSDVPRSDVNYRWVETLLHEGVTGGCGGGQFCPGTDLKRSELAVFLLASKLGASYAPPACVVGEPRRFVDVPATNPFCPWIEDVDRRGYVPPCQVDQYCPNDNIRRRDAAQVVITALRGPNFSPVACGFEPQIYTDVEPSDPDCAWIEELARESMALTGPGGGPPVCDPNIYCPDLPLKRGDASKFMVGAFHLTIERP